MAVLTSGALASLLIPDADTETTVLQCPSAATGTNYQTAIATAWLCNTTASAVTVNVSVVPSGGTAGTANRILTLYALDGYNTLSLNPYLAGTVLGPDDFVSVNVSAASAVVFSATGTVSDASS